MWMDKYHLLLILHFLFIFEFQSFLLSLVVWTKKSLCCCQCVNDLNFLLQLMLVKSKQLVQTTSRRKQMSHKQSINQSIEEESIVELMTSQFFVIALRYCSRKFNIERMLINFNGDDCGVKIGNFNFIKNVYYLYHSKEKHAWMDAWMDAWMHE